MIAIDGYNFEGQYSEHFKNYIIYKRSLGYKYSPRQIRALLYLNKYLAPHPTITKELAESWTAKRVGESFATQAQRAGQLRQVALYLNSLDVSAFVPPIMKSKPSAFVPYIFTKVEITAIIHAVDSLEYEYRSPLFHINYPFLIRLLYSTGLRISEALALRVEDVDFEQRLLRIEQAKHNNFRLIPLPDEMWRSLLIFLEKTNRKSGFFFQNRWNEPYKSGGVLNRFKELMLSAQIPQLENGRMPRIHDLRHTFAVHSLEQMIEQSIDVYVAIPYLSDFLGHRTITTTEQYLRLTTESFGRITEPAEYLAEYLYPKENANENP